MWPFNLFRRNTTDLDKIADIGRALGAAHNMENYVCPKNCGPDGRIGIMPLPKGVPTPRGPMCGTRMVPL